MHFKLSFLLFTLFALTASAAAPSEHKGTHHGNLSPHHKEKNHKHHAVHRVVKAKKYAKGKCNTESQRDRQTVAPHQVSTRASTQLDKVTSACGAPNPTHNTTVSGGPNGKQSWFNCGIDRDGWNPPHVTFDMLNIVSMDSPAAQGTFKECTPYSEKFKTIGAKYNIPPIVLASIAMQESSCNPKTSGDSGGAYGLMQITKDKCGGAPNGDCTESNYNIEMGAKTLADAISAAENNFLLALGSYNGWYKGMTTAQATAARNTGCCDCQQNLDYLQQSLNGWFQGIDPYSQKLGTVQNLAVCESS